MQPKKCLLKEVEKQEKEALKFGFYWDNFNQLIQQIQSECVEIEEAWEKGDLAHLQEEIGDLIQASISLAVFCKLDPHETLSKSIKKFQQRYEIVVELAKNEGFNHLKGQSTKVMMDFWYRAKTKIGNTDGNSK
jgi:uncharacterized protein YabN with tetrapyrrole methylase and pyrophosphatase domain